MWDWRSTGNIANQQWYARTSGWTTLVNVNANKCLDESAPRTGAAVYIYRRTAARNQSWIYEVVNPNVIRLRNQQDAGRPLPGHQGLQPEQRRPHGGLGLLERLEPGLRPELRVTVAS